MSASQPRLRPLSFQTWHPAVWRAGELAHGRQPAHATGFAVLDRELPGGGWPIGALAELLLAQPGQGEIRLLAPVLRELTAAGRPVLLIAPDPIPYAPAWAAWGIDLRQLVVVTAGTGDETGGRAGRANEMLWAAEQALKSASCGAVLAWLPHVRPDQLRRLQLAASGGDALAWVMRPPQALACASPAPLRLELRAAPASRLAVFFHKRRGPARAAPLVLDLPPPHERAAAGPAFRYPSAIEGEAHALLDCAPPATAGARNLPATLAA